MAPPMHRGYSTYDRYFMACGQQRSPLEPPSNPIHERRACTSFCVCHTHKRVHSTQDAADGDHDINGSAPMLAHPKPTSL